jgi:hypothetical protein
MPVTENSSNKLMSGLKNGENRCTLIDLAPITTNITSIASSTTTRAIWNLLACLVPLKFSRANTIQPAQAIIRIKNSPSPVLMFKT